MGDNAESNFLALQSQILSLQYEAQHFGFHPRLLLDIVYNIFFENTTTGLTQMKEYLIKEFKDDIPPNLIKDQTDLFFKKIVKLLEYSIDRLEVYLIDNIFSVDSHVIFPEDEVHVKNPCTKEEDEKLDSEIEELKQKICEEKAKKFSFKKKIIEQKEIKKQLISLESNLKSLLNILNEEGMTLESIESFYSKLSQLENFAQFSAQITP